MTAPERGGDGNGEAFGKPHQRRTGGLRPAAATDDRDRLLGRPDQQIGYDVQPAMKIAPGAAMPAWRPVGSAEYLREKVFYLRKKTNGRCSCPRRTGTADRVAHSNGEFCFIHHPNQLIGNENTNFKQNKNGRRLQFYKASAFSPL